MNSVSAFFFQAKLPQYFYGKLNIKQYFSNRTPHSSPTYTRLHEFYINTIAILEVGQEMS